MKKLILAFLVVGTIATANAQEPRSLLMYGDLNLVSTRDTQLNKHTVWDATIGLGFQYNQHWTVGGNVSWGQDATKDGTTFVKSTFNTYKVGPFLRYSHYLCGSEIFYWFAQWDGLYEGGYHTSGGDPASYKHTGFYSDLFPAIGINVCRSLCLNFSIGGLTYLTDKYTDANNNSNGFTFTFGHQVNFGLSKNFNTGHKMHSSHEPGEEIHRRRMDSVEDEDDAAPKPRKKERNRDEDE